MEVNNVNWLWRDIENEQEEGVFNLNICFFSLDFMVMKYDFIFLFDRRADIVDLYGSSWHLNIIYILTDWKYSGIQIF